MATETKGKKENDKKEAIKILYSDKDLNFFKNP